jgi:hypothetical protein
MSEVEDEADHEAQLINYLLVRPNHDVVVLHGQLLLLFNRQSGFAELVD